jgi:hypothetical protein
MPMDWPESQKLLLGDCRAQMRELPAGIANCSMTSPPYWGLRSYGTEPQVWGGNTRCAHEWTDALTGAMPWQVSGNKPNDVSTSTLTNPKRQHSIPRPASAGHVCVHCQAWLGELGREPRPDLYVAHLVDVFRELRRVLRDDGVIWVNLGDSYATGAGAVRHHPGGGKRGAALAGRGAHTAENSGLASYRLDGYGSMIQPNRLPLPGLKSGDMVGIPWQFAFAMRADGWFLRRDWIFCKRSPMPESVQGWRWEPHRLRVAKGSRGRQGDPGDNGYRRVEDADELGPPAKWRACPGCEKCTPNGGLVLRRGRWRQTTAHEFVFMFAKSARYWSNSEAVKERTLGTANSRGTGIHRKACEEGNGVKQNESFSAAVTKPVLFRNPRSFGLLSSDPLGDEHFAAYPEALVAPFLRATCPERCCPKCGQGWAPVVVVSDRYETRPGNGKDDDSGFARRDKKRHCTVTETSGYRPTCKCGSSDEPVPGVVIDPFLGSGRTLVVAKRLGLRGIGIELLPAYMAMAEKWVRNPDGPAGQREADLAGQINMF